jgi:hypothetical protein
MRTMLFVLVDCSLCLRLPIFIPLYNAIAVLGFQEFYKIFYYSFQNEAKPASPDGVPQSMYYTSGVFPTPTNLERGRFRVPE